MNQVITEHQLKPWKKITGDDTKKTKRLTEIRYKSFGKRKQHS